MDLIIMLGVEFMKTANLVLCLFTVLPFHNCCLGEEDIASIRSHGVRCLRIGDYGESIKHFTVIMKGSRIPPIHINFVERAPCLKITIRMQFRILPKRSSSTEMKRRHMNFVDVPIQ